MFVRFKNKTKKWTKKRKVSLYKTEKKESPDSKTK